MRQRLSLKARALQCLSQREHSAFELRRKLLEHVREALRLPANDTADASDALAQRTRRVPPTPEALAEVDTLLGWLTATGLLSDARFAEARIRARAARQGNMRIHRELAQHGLRLTPDDARALKDSELARAKGVWMRKFGAAAGDAAGTARQIRFLAARGFSAEVIRRVVRGDDDTD